MVIYCVEFIAETAAIIVGGKNTNGPQLYSSLLTWTLFSAILRRSAGPLKAEIPRAIKALTAGIVKVGPRQANCGGRAHPQVTGRVPLDLSDHKTKRDFHRILIR